MAPPRDLDEEPEQIRHAVATFNAGDYYAAHDLFEALWGEAVWKGLVQAAVALHHHGVHNAKGWQGLPESVDRLLAPYDAGYAGLDVGRFRREFRAFFRAVNAGDPPPPPPRLSPLP